MIYPTATDILRNIDYALKDKVEPTIREVSGLSTLATVRHLLNYVRARIENEGQLLTDEIAKLEGLLGDTRAYLADIGDAHAGELAAALERIPVLAEGRYHTLDDLGARAAGLRDAMHAALARLQDLRAEHGAKADYKALRAAIRDYVVKQTEAEGEIIGPAFFGRGPRR